MTEYPNNIKTFRTVQDLPGVVYDASKASTIFAKDNQDLFDEVAAIESTLGTNPQGGVATVGARLDAIEGAGGGGQTTYTLIVAPTGGDYATLGAAIAAATAGATIYVRAGTYIETTITSTLANLTICGENKYSTILDFGASVLTLTGANLVLTNVKLKYTTGRVMIGASGTLGVDINNCNLEQNGTCGSNFYTQNGTRGQLKNCGISITSTDTDSSILFKAAQGVVSGNAIYQERSNSNLLEMNAYGATCSNNTLYCANSYDVKTMLYAPQLATVTGNTVTGNNLSDYSTGITVSGGVAMGNLILGQKYGIRSSSSLTVVISNKIYARKYGVWIDGHYNNIAGNAIYMDGTATGYGIYNSSRVQTTITNNIISGAPIGISTGTTTKHTIVNNNFTSCAVNVSQDSPDNYVTGNTNPTPAEDVASYYLYNASGAAIDAGSVVVRSASAAGDNITTTTPAGDVGVCGITAATIAAAGRGVVQVKGKTKLMRVDGTTDIAIGDYLKTHTTAGIASKAAAGDTVIAIAIEAYAADDANGVIDALIINPRII